MGRQLAEHPCTFASTFESCSFHVKQSKQSARRRIVKTKVAKKNVPCNSRAVYSGGTASFADANGKRQNCGFPTRGTLYFLAAKSTKNSPADAFAYFVPSNVRNGRLFAGTHRAPAPFLYHVLAGPSFERLRHRAGIFRRLWRREKRRNGWIGNAESCHRRGTRREVVRIIACSGKRTARRRSVKKRGRFARKPAKAPVLA